MSLATATYAPTFLAEIGLGAMLPLFALSVLALDKPAAMAAAAVALYSLGRIAGSAWGGRLTGVLGPARAAMVSLATLALGAVVCGLSDRLGGLLAGIVLVGGGHAAYHVARQGQLALAVPHAARARAFTTLAGTWRISNFIGPVIGAAVIAWRGLDASYLFAALTVVAAMATLRLTGAWRSRRTPSPHPHSRARDVMRDNLGTLRTLGLAVGLTGAVRAARLVVIPLWAASVGVEDHTVSLIFSASAAVDMLLFYPAGVVMDRWGRVWTAVPSTLALALGTVALTMTDSVTGVTLASLVLGIGNGWGSGVLMTLGNDVAPTRGRDMFVGLWMMLSDVGGMAGPALVSGIAAATLSGALWGVGALGVVASAALWRWIPSGDKGDADAIARGASASS